MDLETVEHLALDIAKSGTRMRRVMVSAKHRSMIQRKWVDENMRPLSRQEILTILDTEADRLAELGRTKFLRKRRTLWEVARGRPAAMMDYTGMDAASMMALRAQVSARAVGRKQFNEAVGKIFGGYDPTAKDAVRLPGFPDRAFTPEVATELGSAGSTAPRISLKPTLSSPSRRTTLGMPWVISGT
jgi:hypothetical protein